LRQQMVDQFVHIVPGEQLATILHLGLLMYVIG
jgi:hypothetical protein